jgi:Fe-S cluster biogenesis protein NfuA
MEDINIDLVSRVNETLNKIRPYLIADGGDVTLEEITPDMEVRVKLTGACESCPFSVHTLKAGVEQAIRQEIPEIKSVTAI